MTTVGERIKQARIAANLSQARLAERAKPLSAMAISNYERGADTPRPSVLLRLAKALQVPTEFFFRQTEVKLWCIQYRKRSDLGKWAQDAVQEQVREQLERYLEVEALFPGELALEHALSPSDRCVVGSLEEAEDAAMALRERWHLGTDPINNLTETLEDHGIRVLLVEAPDRFDGLSCWANDTVPVIVANTGKPWDRLRSDAAHELGELLLRIADPVPHEKAAQRFAGAFLVAREAVVRELGRSRGRLSTEELVLLKEEYGLSMQGWVRRAFDCGVITQAHYTQWCRFFSKSNLRMDERTVPRPADIPQRFRKLVHRAEAEGLITPIRRAELLREVPKPSHPRPTEQELRRASADAATYPLTAEDMAWLSSAGEDGYEQGRGLDCGV